MFRFHLQPLKRSLVKTLQHELQDTEGFTLLEVLVVVVIVGFISAISAPGWSAFMNGQRAKDANERSFAAIRSAQSQAIQTRRSYRASFQRRTIAGEDQVRYSIHPTTLTYGTTGLVWENLPSLSLLDTTSTTLTADTTTVPGSTFYYVEFDFQGNVRPPFGKLVFESTLGSTKQACTIISTIIGGMRIASDSSCD